MSICLTKRNMIVYCLFISFQTYLINRNFKIYSFGKMNILMYLLEKYPEKPWKWDCISYNPNITMEFIEKHSDKHWS